MDNIKKLMIKHAKFADEARGLQSEMSAELDQCEHNKFDEIITEDDIRKNPEMAMYTCVNTAYFAKQIMDKENNEHYEYDEVLFNYGCDHCIEYRKLKLKHGEVRKSLGRIRSAITRVGRSLNE